MTDRVEGDVEILVHITAPSKGKDDANYRALALAYLRFEPVSHHTFADELDSELAVALDDEVSIHTENELQEPCLEDTLLNTNELNGRYKSRRLECPPSSRSTNITRSMKASLLIDSPRLSFGSILDNLDSPALRSQPRPRHAREPDVPGNNASWHTPPSMIADSQSPYNCVVPEFSSPTGVLELYLQHFDAPEPPLSSVRQEIAFNRLAESPHNILGGAAPSETGVPSVRTTPSSSVEDITDVILATPPFSRSKTGLGVDITNKKHLVSPKRAPHLKIGPSVHVELPENGLDLVERLALTYSKSSNRPSAQLSTSRKRQCVEQCIPGTPFRPAKLSKTARNQITHKAIIANEIHPPPPITSSNVILPSNITPDLHLLATQLSLALRFRPRVKARLLRPLERGYWSISMAAWDLPLRERVWNALENYVAKTAKAGWGVWCARCEPKFKQNKQEGNRVELGNMNDALLELRVYCWGEVVGHIYLLLHLVTERKIKGRGAKWIDGGGEVVIIMP